MSLTAPRILVPKCHDRTGRIAAGFTTRRGGRSRGPYASLNLGMNTTDDAESVKENRRLVERAMGFGLGSLAVAGQVHGSRVVAIDAPGLYAECDGLVTTAPGVLLGIVAADCAAVLLADERAGVVGACHSGWRGTVAGIAGATVREMEKLGATPARMTVYISPCISAAAFEVGKEVAAQFDAAFVNQPEGAARPFVDIKGAIRETLLQAGVPSPGIEVAAECTYSDTDTFFSHRAEKGTTGRMMGLIGLRS